MFKYDARRFASRLTGIKENTKFQKNGQDNEQNSGLKHVVDEAKQHHNVKYGLLSLNLLSYFNLVLHFLFI